MGQVYRRASWNWRGRGHQTKNCNCPQPSPDKISKCLLHSSPVHGDLDYCSPRSPSELTFCVQQRAWPPAPCKHRHMWYRYGDGDVVARPWPNLCPSFFSDRNSWKRFFTYPVPLNSGSFITWFWNKASSDAEQLLKGKMCPSVI